MKTNLHALVLAAAQIVFQGICSGQTTAYFPELKKGSDRVYSIEISSPLRLAQKGTATLSVTGYDIIAGQKYSRTVTTTSGFPGMPQDIKYIRRAKDGIWVIEEDAKDKPEYREIPFPITVGAVWSFTNSTGVIRCKAESIEDIKLSGKTIKDCLRISQSRTNADGTVAIANTYYRKRLGDVKGTLESEGTRIVTQLLDPSP